MQNLFIDCRDTTAQEPWALPEDWPAPAVFFTSPRYNLGIQYGTDEAGQRIDDATDHSHHYFQLRETWQRCADISGAGATLWINLKPQNPTEMSSLHAAALASGWVLQHTFAWVWHTALPDGTTIGHFSPTPNAVNPHWGFEHVYLYRKANDPPRRLQRDADGVGVPYADKSNLTRFTAGNGGQEKPDRRCRGNVWIIPRETIVGRAHPCPFPAALPEMAFRLLALPVGSVVVDPFCGIGNTGRAALRCRLRFYGIDRNPNYCAEAFWLCAAEKIKAAVRRSQW